MQAAGTYAVIAEDWVRNIQLTLSGTRARAQLQAFHQDLAFNFVRDPLACSGSCRPIIIPETKEKSFKLVYVLSAR
jgi:hypothetical protein